MFMPLNCQKKSEGGSLEVWKYNLVFLAKILGWHQKLFSKNSLYLTKKVVWWKIIELKISKFFR